MGPEKYAKKLGIILHAELRKLVMQKKRKKIFFTRV